MSAQNFVRRVPFSRAVLIPPVAVFTLFIAMLTLKVSRDAIAPIPKPIVALSKDAAQVLALQAQVETLRESNQNLIDVVCWSLGIVITAIAVLAGYGWFSNFKIYERDKADLQALIEEYKKDYQGKIDMLRTELTSLQNEFNAAFPRTFRKVKPLVNARDVAFVAELLTGRKTVDWSYYLDDSEDVVVVVNFATGDEERIVFRHLGSAGTDFVQIAQHFGILLPPSTNPGAN